MDASFRVRNDDAGTNVEFNKKSISKDSSAFLDLVRLIACESVVLGHSIVTYQLSPGESIEFVGRMLAGTGIVLLFALSGLLISHSVFNKSSNPGYRFRSFFIDRFSRIYSGLLPALLLVTVVDGLIFVTNHSYFVQLFTHCQNPTVSNFAVNLLMLEHFPVEFFNGILSVFSLKLPLINFATYGFDGPLWALPIEWWLYMLFGWVSIQVLGKRKNKVVFFTIAILLSLMALGNAWVENGAYVSLTIAWFLGVLMTLAISNKNLNRVFERKHGIKLLGLALVLLLTGTIYAVFRTFAYTHLWYDVGLGIMLSACLFASVLYLNNASRSSGNWFSKRFAGALAIGAGYSYTLYLIHFPIILLFNGINLQTDRWLMIGFILLITNVIAYSVAHFTEKRHKQLGKMIKQKLNISE